VCMSTAIVAQQRPVERILSHLQGVRRTGEGRWVARCPAHNDEHPSLSVREAPDGKVLLRCWAGCDTAAVLAALGLRWSDLFPDGKRRPRTARECNAASEEAVVRFVASRFDEACREAYERLAVICCAVGHVFAVYGLDITEAEAAWVRELPHMEYVLDRLMAEDPEERLAGLEEARQWLI
jgi:hypothetical protein